MRAHFLNPVFQLVQRKSDEHIKETVPEGSQYMKNTPKDIQDEIDIYVNAVSYVVQFQSILPAIQEELSRHESVDAEEAEEIKRGGMKTRKGRKGTRKNKCRKYGKYTYRRCRI
jgi:hypothetical protein